MLPTCGVWFLAVRAPPETQQSRHLVGRKALEARPGNLLPLAGVPVHLPPLPARELREVIPRGPPCLCKCPDPPPRVVRIRRKGALERRNAPGSKGEDFVPWVPTDSEEPQDLKEKERRERMTGLLDRYAARKRKRQVILLSSILRNRVCRLVIVSPSLMAVRGTRPSSSPALPN